MMILDSRWSAATPHDAPRNAPSAVHAHTVSRRVMLAMTIVALALVPRLAGAQAYPDRLIRVVLGVPAGSGSDLSARLVAAALEPELGQRVIGEIGIDDGVAPNPARITALELEQETIAVFDIGWRGEVDR